MTNNHDRIGLGLLKEALRIAGTQMRLAELTGISQASISIAVRRGWVTAKMLRSLASGMSRRKLGRQLAVQLSERAEAIERRKLKKAA